MLMCMCRLFPQLLNHTSIPVHTNADILEPTTTSKRWPVIVFSHGLGGSRNAYSHICGSLASHGIVVVAPDHRDGSAPISFVHTPDVKEKLQRVEYKRIDHKPSAEVYQARDEQLRVRLWEIGLIHDALLKIDERTRVRNVAEDQTKHAGKDMLTMFSHLLNVHEPGAIGFAGHSFGACTTVQLLKSVFHRTETPVTGYKPLFTPSASSRLAHQITPATPALLFDLWTLPIQSPDTAWLSAKPMPAYSGAQGGRNILAVLSEGFYKWTSNMQQTKLAVAPPKSATTALPGPHIFYPVASAHLSQSDFGVLFPWATAKVFGAREPERVLRLNVRAALQVLRENGWEVAPTSAADREVEGGVDSAGDDSVILTTQQDSVRGWVCIGDQATGTAQTVDKGPGESMVEGEALGQVVESGQR
jgi:platelet-activating factor acetylhydrolase